MKKTYSGKIIISLDCLTWLFSWSSVICSTHLLSKKNTKLSSYSLCSKKNNFRKWNSISICLLFFAKCRACNGIREERSTLRFFLANKIEAVLKFNWCVSAQKGAQNLGPNNKSARTHSYVRLTWTSARDPYSVHLSSSLHVFRCCCCCCNAAAVGCLINWVNQLIREKVVS